jgi:hypothetical protein
MPSALYIPIWLGAAWLAVACAIELFRPRYTDSVRYQAALESAKLMKDWCTWMTGIATAAIAANGIIMAETSCADGKEFASLSVTSFCIAIVLDAWLLGSLPSIISRLKYDTCSEDNDIYELPIFSFLPRMFFRLGFVAGIQHLAFVVAVYALAVSAASRTA